MALVKEEKKKEKPKKQKGLSLRVRLFLMMITLVSAAFLPVTIVLIIGMLPTIAASLVDTTHEKTRTLTIGLMNFTACFPFLIDIAMQVQTLDIAFQVLSDPLKIVLMYSGAIAGYFLDWTMAGMSNVIMTARARQRIDHIEKRQTELKRRFGPEVTGEIALDGDGFPLVQIEE